MSNIEPTEPYIYQPGAVQDLALWAVAFHDHRPQIKGLTRSAAEQVLALAKGPAKPEIALADLKSMMRWLKESIHDIDTAPAIARIEKYIKHCESAPQPTPYK